MKKLYTLLAVVMLTASAFAQAPEKMSYQAVVRDAANALVSNKAVGMQISILQGSVSGTAVYVERQVPTTNMNGLVSIEIGSGTVVLGTFASVDWSAGPYFIKTETDPTGGIIYTITGTSQLLSVPYALHANTAGSITGTITETDPVFGASISNGITAADTANWNNHFNGQYSSLTGTPTTVSTFTNDAGYLTTEGDSSITNEIQALSISNDTVFLSNGGFVKLPNSSAGAYTGGSNITVSGDTIHQITNMHPYLAINFIICISGGASGATIGEITMFAGSGSSVPSGWALCDGQLVSIASFSQLFSIIGTVYGGNGQTTFALPDLRSRSPMHQGTGPGLSPRSLGSKGGVE